MVHISSRVTEKMQFNYLPIMSMGALCCLGNPTMRQIATILITVKPPNYGQTASMALEELSFEVLTDEQTKGQIDEQTDGRMTKSDHYSSS